MRIGRAARARPWDGSVSPEEEIQRVMDMALPSGTVTFLFTDIEGSSKLWEEHPEAMRLALARHDAVLRNAIETHGGHVFKTIGDAFCAAFATPLDAIASALAAQCALQAEDWAELGSLRVRMALNTGAADEREGDYFGPPLNRVARLMAAGHGGQILLSLATQERVRDQLPEGASLRDLGERRLRDLVHPERIFQLVGPDLPAEFPPLRSLEAFSHNLPVQLTSFVGREQVMADVKGLLSTTHLLTLTGSGGCGKTRLAMQVAADLVEEYTDGVWLVQLAALSDPTLVPQTVAAALGVREQLGRSLTDTLSDYLSPKSVLLLLDNCEHLLSASAQLAEALLRSCPHLRILASSREALSIGGETTYRVPSLTLPDVKRLPTVESLLQFEAVSLFVDRAAAALPSFTVAPQNAAAVAQVCRRLDGIPLALELAAARVRVLPVEKIADRLDDRFRFLTGGSRTALPRQQTLRATIDWSYDLLSQAERKLLLRLSVFAGGWTLPAAEAICAGEEIEEWEVLDLLASLVEKSLVVYEEPTTRAAGGEARYRLLETIRQYARERLLEVGEAEAVRTRHRDWFLGVAEEAESELHGPTQGEWLERLEEEHDNLRVALDWLMESQQTEAGLRLAAALWVFWELRGYLTEGRERLTRSLTLAKETAPCGLRIEAHAKALSGAGLLAGLQDDYPTANSLLEEAVSINREVGSRIGTAFSLLLLGNVTLWQGAHTRARALHEESLTIYRELGEKWGIGHLLNRLGCGACDEGDLATARALLEESLAIQRELGDTWGIAASHHYLGIVSQKEEDWSAACAHHERSLTLSRELGDKMGIARSLTNLARVAYGQNDCRAARGLNEESLALQHELGNKLGTASCLEGLAAVACAQGEPERASQLFGAAEALREALGAPLPPYEHELYDPRIAAARTTLGEREFAAAWAEGRDTPLDAAVTYALEGKPPSR